MVAGSSGAGSTGGRPADPQWSPQKAGAESSEPFNVQQASSSGVSSSQATQQAAPTQQAAEAMAAETPTVQQISRPVNKSDVTQLLMNLGLDKSHLSLALMLMEHNIEISSEMLNEVLGMLKGKKRKSAMEAAVVSRSKGFKDAESAKFLEKFLLNPQEMSKEMGQLQKAFSHLNAALSSDKFLNSGLVASLSSLIAELDEEFKKLTKKASGETISLSKVRFGGLP